MKHERRVTATPEARRMELQYCERCGALHVVPAEASGNVCRACVGALRWVYGRGQKEKHDASSDL